MEEIFNQAEKLAEAFVKSKRKFYHLIYKDGTEEALDIIVKPHKEA